MKVNVEIETYITQDEIESMIKEKLQIHDSDYCYIDFKFIGNRLTAKVKAKRNITL